MRLKSIPASLIERFAAIVGEAHALTRAEDQAPYLREWRDRYTGKTPVVLRPGSTEEVSRILALANEHDIGIVPQGGNTGLVGGQIPSPEGNEIVLSLARLRSVRDIDAAGSTMIVEAGVTLLEAQNAAQEADRLFPLSLASEGSAMIGGVLATNAGGTAVLAYGNARNLTLGLEAVLADGRVWHGLRRLKKDNTGYDLRDLLIGSEGTLGVITAACLKLLPMPAERETAIVAFQSPDDALKLLRLAERHAGQSLTAFEFWAARAQEFALRFMPNVRDPFADQHPWYALIELSQARGNDQRANAMEYLLTAASEDGVIRDAVIRRIAAAGAGFLAPARRLLGSTKRRRRQHQARHLRAGRPHSGIPDARRRRRRTCLPGRASGAVRPFRRRQSALQRQRSPKAWIAPRIWRSGRRCRMRSSNSSRTSTARSRPNTASAK